MSLDLELPNWIKMNKKAVNNQHVDDVIHVR